MKSRTRMWMTVVSLFAALAMPVGMTAQDNPSQDHKTKHHQYKLIDLGTLGGPNGFIMDLTAEGVAMAEADMSTPDPYAPNCVQDDCLLNHGFRWKQGVKSDLGALPGVNSAFPFVTNARGQSAGGSQNSLLDPLTGFPEFRAALWQGGKVVDLGTFGGNNSIANSLNSGGQVVGAAQNTIPDSYAFCNQPFVYATQVHAFSWQQGVMRDLGTLGGDDSCALLVNELGQVAGFSYTNSIPNPNTGIPTLDPFLWERGKMWDLGTLGGTFGYPNSINGRGQVVGESNMPGDFTGHPFLWDRGVLTDLGTLGGSNGEAFWINDGGEVVGQADLPGSGQQLHHGFLSKRGAMIDLGTVGADPCSRAISNNSNGQIVGASTTCTEFLRAFLWENGGPMVDLNTLIHPGSDLTVVAGSFINERGEIAGNALLPNGDQHAVLMIPDGDCDDDCEGRIAASQYNAAPAYYPATMTQGSESPATRVDQLRNRFGSRYHTKDQPAAPLN
jgi:probable HAF family extracellular repeat protein